MLRYTGGISRSFTGFNTIKELYAMIAIASDHGGFALKQELLALLKEKGIRIQ